MKKIFKILTLFFAFLVTNNLFSQLSKIHYIPPLTHERSGNNFDTNAPEDQWFYISTPSVSDVPFTIKRANGDIMYSAVVSNANPWIDRAAPSGVEYGYLFIRRRRQKVREILQDLLLKLKVISMFLLDLTQMRQMVEINIMLAPWLVRVILVLELDLGQVLSKIKQALT